MKKLLMETAIPVNFTQALNNIGWDWDPSDTNKMYHMLFMSITDCLGFTKSKDKKTAVAVKDLKGNLLLAGVVDYTPNENEDMPGNWNYVFTTDIEDIKDANVIDTNDNRFLKVFATTAYNLYHLEFHGGLLVTGTIEVAVNSLKQWLDVNASETEEVEIEEPGYFLASVVVENGEKIVSIVPDGAMKRLIKDDSALEEN